MDESKSLLKRALMLKPQDRFTLIEGLIQSLDEPDRELDQIWVDEVLSRAGTACRIKHTHCEMVSGIFGPEFA